MFKLFQNKVFAVFLMLACLVSILFASLSGYVAYFYTLLIFGILNLFCEKKYRYRNFAYFHYFLLLAIFLYFFQKYQFPEYMGLSGPERVGTDDIRYYYGLGTKVTYSIERWDIAFNNTLSKFIKIVFLPKIKDPIDVVIFNILGITFIPYLTKKSCELLCQDHHVGVLAERFILFCPFMMSIGLIIMRDVLCTSLILASFICFANKRYIYMAILAGLLTYLKFGFTVFLGIVIVVYMFSQEERDTKNRMSSKIKYIIATISFLTLFLLYIMPNLSEITGGRLSSGSLFRESYLEYLEGANEESILVKLYSLPIAIRLPILIVTFLVIPPLSSNFIWKDHFLMGNFFQSFLSPIYWCYLYIFLFDFLFSYKRLRNGGKAVFYSMIFLALALGMISLQFRHKVVLMPFIYMAIAYAIKNKLRGQRSLSIISLFVFILAQFVYLYTHL